jgi:hypothetical protein
VVIVDDDDEETPIERLRLALGRADALASAVNGLIEGAAIDDARERERAAYLAELCAEQCAAAVDALRALVARCEGTGPARPGSPAA